MADNNLDDFFAKRDKKKKTGKNKKFDTAEDLAKILGKRTEERKKLEGGKSQYVSEDGVVQPVAPGLGNEDDEWIDAEEKQPDYTGLKIQELILEDEDEIEVKDPEISEGTENAPSDGAWRKKAARKTVPAYEPRKDEESESEGATTPVDNVNETQNPATTEEVNSEESVPVIKPVVEDTESSNIDVSAPAPVPAAAPTPAPAAGGKYITPSQRRAMEAAAKGGPPPPQPSSTPSRNMMDDPDAGSIVKGAYVPPGRRAGATSATVAAKPRKTTAAPNINDEEYFPSLGGS